jgi:hypothetical protein
MNLSANDEHERDFEPKSALVEFAARAMWRAVLEDGKEFGAVEKAILDRFHIIAFTAAGIEQ